MKDGNAGKNRLNLASGAKLDTLSKSFERLDVINQRRDRARRARARKHEGYSEDDTETHIMEQHNSEKISRRRDNKKGATRYIDSGVNGKEVTIAKVGRFKFNLELNKSLMKSPNKKKNDGIEENIETSIDVRLHLKVAEKEEEKNMPLVPKQMVEIQMMMKKR